MASFHQKAEVKQEEFLAKYKSYVQEAESGGLLSQSARTLAKVLFTRVEAGTLTVDPPIDPETSERLLARVAISTE